MKTYLTTILLAAAALTMPAADQSSTPAPAALARDIRLERYVEPRFPLRFRNTTTNEGYAQAQLLVAADGRIVECFVSAYSHQEFAAAVEQAVQGWLFRASEPAVAGALPQRFNVRFNFRREGMVVIQGDVQETVRSFFNQKDSDTSVAPCKLRDLDNTPEPVTLIVPAYPEELKKQGIEGGAAVSFFIDEQGRVRTPSVAGTTRPEFAAAALEAVGKWTFAPPRRKGQPTRVFAVQEFSFSPGSATTSVTSKPAN